VAWREQAEKRGATSARQRISATRLSPSKVRTTIDLTDLRRPTTTGRSSCRAATSCSRFLEQSLWRCWESSSSPSWKDEPPSTSTTKAPVSSCIPDNWGCCPKRLPTMAANKASRQANRDQPRKIRRVCNTRSSRLENEVVCVRSMARAGLTCGADETRQDAWPAVVSFNLDRHPTVSYYWQNAMLGGSTGRGRSARIGDIREPCRP
jgi:hypothetical protein